MAVIKRFQRWIAAWGVGGILLLAVSGVVLAAGEAPAPPAASAAVDQTFDQDTSVQNLQGIEAGRENPPGDSALVDSDESNSGVFDVAMNHVKGAGLGLLVGGAVAAGVILLAPLFAVSAAAAGAAAAAAALGGLMYGLFTGARDFNVGQALAESLFGAATAGIGNILVERVFMGAAVKFGKMVVSALTGGGINVISYLFQSPDVSWEGLLQSFGIGAVMGLGFHLGGMLLGKAGGWFQRTKLGTILTAKLGQGAALGKKALGWFSGRLKNLGNQVSRSLSGPQLAFSAEGAGAGLAEREAAGALATAAKPKPIADGELPPIGGLKSAGWRRLSEEQRNSRLKVLISRLMPKNRDTVLEVLDRKLVKWDPTDGKFRGSATFDPAKLEDAVAAKNGRRETNILNQVRGAIGEAVTKEYVESLKGFKEWLVPINHASKQGVDAVAIVEEEVNGVIRKTFHVVESKAYGSTISPKQVSKTLMTVLGKGPDEVVSLNGRGLVDYVKLALGDDTGIVQALRDGIAAGDGSVVYHVVIPKGTPSPKLLRLADKTLSGVLFRVSVLP